MDWLRRNWPDMLIGLALVAVIAGIVATLLTGGTFFPLGSGGTAAQGGGDVDTPPSVSVPRAEPDPEDGGAGAGGRADGGAEGPDGPGVAVLPPSDDGESSLGGGLAAPPGAPDPAVSPPSEAEAQPGSPEAPSPAAAQDGGAGVAERADEEPSAAVAEPPEEPGRSEAVPSPEEATPTLPTEPFRVSVGAFGSAENAQRQAERFRGAGYSVFIGRQDQFHIVLVGPYSEEAEARRVAGEIGGGDYGVEPVIYHFQPDGTHGAAGADAADAPEVDAPFAADEEGDASPAASAPPSVAEADAAPEPAAEGAASAPAGVGPDADASEAPIASNAGILLQVGAYADVESAEPQVQRLESLGLTARRLQEAGMVKLVVGPFSGQALEDARVVLDGAGIDHFAR